jgi:hypothetical protein
MTGVGLLARPSFWRAVSSVLLVAFAVAFLVSGFTVPGWGWIALLLSGVTFGIELVLLAFASRTR